MKKLLFILFPLILLYIVAAIYIAPFFVSGADVQTNAGEAIKAATGREVIFSSAITRRYFPLPKYAGSGIQVKNIEGFPSEFMLETGEVVLRPGILSLLIFHPKIASVTINNPVFRIDMLPGGATNIGGLFAQGNSAASGFPDIHLIDGKFMLRKGGDETNITLLNTAITHAADNLRPVKVTAIFGSGVKVVNFAGDFGRFDAAADQLPLTGALTAGASKFSFDGAITHPAHDPVFAGKMALDVNRLAKLVAAYIGMKNLTGRLPEQNFSISGTGEISTSRLEIPSAETLFAGGKGSGSLEVLFQEKDGPLLGIAMKIPGIDFDALSAAVTPDKKAASDKKEAAKTPPEIPNPDVKTDLTEDALLPENLEIIFDISGDEVIYHQQKISDVKLRASLAKGRQVIENFSFGLPGNSKLEFSAEPGPGEDGQGEQVNGHIKFYGDNLALCTEYLDKLGINAPKINLENFFAESDFVYAGKKIYFPNLDILLSDAGFSGKVLFDWQKARLEAIIQAANLDLDKILPAIDITKKLGDLDSNITIFDSLRTLPYTARVAFSADELMYGENKYAKSAGEIGISGGILSSSFEAGESLAGGFKAALKIDASSLKPTFEGNITADHLTLDNFIAFRKKLEDIVYLGREKPAPVQPKFDNDPAEAKIWPVDVLNFSGVNFMDGILKVSSKTFTLGKLEFKDLSTVMKIQEGVLALDPFKATLFGGPFDLKANIATRGRPGASITYALSNADFGDMLELLTKTKVISGRFGISGSASFSGFNINDWMSSASGSANLLARNMVVTGLNLKDIYDRLTSMKTPNAYETFMKNAFSEGTTKFDFLGGNLFLNEGILTTKNLNLKGTYITQGAYNAKANIGNLNIQSELAMNAAADPTHSIPVTFYIRGKLDDLHGDWDYTAFKPYWETKSLEKEKEKGKTH